MEEKSSITHTIQHRPVLPETLLHSLPLFFNNRHEKLTREGISYILATYADLARNVSPDLIPERISCHSLRHSRAMHVEHAGFPDVIYISTMIYRRLAREGDLFCTRKLTSKGLV